MCYQPSRYTWKFPHQSLSSLTLFHSSSTALSRRFHTALTALSQLFHSPESFTPLLLQDGHTGTSTFGVDRHLCFRQTRGGGGVRPRNRPQAVRPPPALGRDCRRSRTHTQATATQTCALRSGVQHDTDF